MKFLSPRSDISFKKLFANEHNKKLTMAFLNNILNLSGSKKIMEINLREAVNLPDRAAGKEIIFDVYCTDKHNNHYIIEMQSVNEYNFFERAQYYAARVLGNQLKQTEDYITLLPVVFVGVVNYSLDIIKKYKRHEDFRSNAVIALEEHLKKTSDVVSKYSFINHATNAVIPVPLLELNFVELPKFKKTIEECTTEIDQWLYLMTQADECHEIPEQMKSSNVFKDAFQTLEQRNWTPEELIEYVEEQEAIGREERVAQGNFHYGRQEGKIEAQQQAAINFLKMGLSVEMIAQGTGLSIQEIELLRTKF